MINNHPFETLIANLKDSGKYRVFNDIMREKGKFPQAIWYGPYNIKNIVNNILNITLKVAPYAADPFFKLELR